MATFPLLSAAPVCLRRLSLLLALGALAVQPVPGLAQTQPDGRNPGVIQLMNQIDAQQAEIGRLRGQLEVLSNGLENAQKRQRDMYVDLDTRLRRIEQQGGDSATKAEGRTADLDARVKRLEQQAAADGAKEREPQWGDIEGRIKRLEQQMAAAPGTIPPPVSTAPTPSSTIAVPTAPVTPVKPTPPTVPTAGAPATPTPAATEQAAVRKAYDAGTAAYNRGDYQGAIAAFDGIVKRFPRDPLAAKAQYWIGDSWFNLRDFKSAAAAQQALIANYPDSPKVPDALLNLSSAYVALGDSASARKTLEDLIARFPQSEAAEKGKARLARIK
jgi:tol-pal system protein YbgF